MLAGMSSIRNELYKYNKISLSQEIEKDKRKIKSLS